MNTNSLAMKQSGFQIGIPKNSGISFTNGNDEVVAHLDLNSIPISFTGDVDAAAGILFNNFSFLIEQTIVQAIENERERCDGTNSITDSKKKITVKIATPQRHVLTLGWGLFKTLADYGRKSMFEFARMCRRPHWIGWLLHPVGGCYPHPSVAAPLLCVATLI